MTVISKKTVAASLVWKFLERGSAQLVAFVVSLVLARILGPSDYGVVSLVLVFTSISLVFVQGGFNTALIQRRDATETDYSSALMFSLVVAFAVYAALFFAAPWVAAFYGEPSIEAVLRVLALLLIPGAYNSIQVAYATSNFMFKKLFLANLVSVICSGAVGISLALCGAGVWALVGQQLGNQLFICLVLAAVLRWRPGLAFSAASVRVLFSFGGNVLASNLLVQVFLNLRSVIVGKLYDAATLGLFNRGRQFSTALMEAISGSMQEVMLPTFSKVQDSAEDVLVIVRRSVKTSCFIIFPLMFGLSGVALPLVSVLLGEAWEGCVPFLQLFAIAYVFQPIQIVTAQAMRGLGNSAMTLRLEVVRKTAELILMLASIPLGVVALAASSIVAGAISCAVAFVPNAKVLGYGLRDQLADLAHPFAGSIVMVVCVLAVRLLGLGNLATLLLQVIVGIVVYALAQLAMRDETMAMLVAAVKKAARRARR